MSQNVNENENNQSRTYKDPYDGQPIYFDELGIREVGSIFDNLLVLLAGILLTIGAGLIVELVVRMWREKSSQAQGAGNADPPATGRA